MYGFGNWNEVAEYVGTKSKSQCIDHYNAVYMNSPCFPLPVSLFENSVIDSIHATSICMHGLIDHMHTQDLSHVMGKSREELLEMAKEHEVKKGLFLYDLNHNFWRFCLQHLISLFDSVK